MTNFKELIAQAEAMPGTHSCLFSREDTLVILRSADALEGAEEEMARLRKERDAARAQLAELQALARAVVATLASPGGGRACLSCYALATKDVPMHCGSTYRCDACHRPDPQEAEDEDGRRTVDTVAAGPLRALLAALPPEAT